MFIWTLWSCRVISATWSFCQRCWFMEVYTTTWSSSKGKIWNLQASPQSMYFKLFFLRVFVYFRLWHIIYAAILCNFLPNRTLLRIIKICLLFFLRKALYPKFRLQYSYKLKYLCKGIVCICAELYSRSSSNAGL